MISKKEINKSLKNLIEKHKIIKDGYEFLRKTRKELEGLQTEQSKMEKDIIEFILSTETENLILVEGTSYTFRIHKPYNSSVSDYDLVWEEANSF